MTAYSPYEEKVDTRTVDFHVDFLCDVLRFLDGRGIHTPGDLERVCARKLLTEPLWKISEANLLECRKHNVRFYSEQAHLLCSKTNLISTSRKKDGVEHEHIIPRTLLEALLLKNRTNKDEIRRIASFAVACVVTTTEHRRLEGDPWQGADPTADPWRRYREAPEGAVRVWDRKTGAWLDLGAGLPA